MADELRVATFNASLNRGTEGQLITDLSTPTNAQAQDVAEVIQKVAPDIILVNEFDYDAAGEAASLFSQNYLEVAQNGATPIEYPFVYAAPSNTGILSGFDLDNNGFTAQEADRGSFPYANDSQGFGQFPGQFAFVIYSKYEIDTVNIRTFQEFLWKDMPGARLPDNLATPEAADWYSPDELAILRLSSKNHVDVPVIVNGEVVHILAAHPTPPVFDGPEDRNGQRNFDEIRFWSDYVNGEEYFYDDQGGTGGLAEGSRFVILGDYNSDPFDGDSVPGAAQQLLDNPNVNGATTDAALIPASEGGPEAAALQGGANLTHEGNPAFDTSDFNDTAPGNLRVDYALPSRAGLEQTGQGVFWPTTMSPDGALAAASDHRLVHVDVTLNQVGTQVADGIYFLGSVEIPTGEKLAGTTIGGLSGIDYDRASGTYVAVSDDRDAGADGTPRTYDLAIDLADGTLDEGDVVVFGTTALKLPGGQTLDAINPDLESIRIGAGGTTYISSERDFLGNPAIYRLNDAGVVTGGLPIDIKFQPNATGTNGVRNNLGFESLTISPDGRTLFAATESALRQDGPASTLTDGSTARIIKYDVASGLPTAEYVYEVGPIAQPPNPSTGFADNGLVELLATRDPDVLLALERSFSTGAEGRGYSVKLYKIDLDGATDVSGEPTLGGAPGLVPATKELLLDLGKLGITLDNIEGMTFGPTMADGKQTLIIASDDNFGGFGPQASQFIALGLDLGLDDSPPMLVGKDGWETTPVFTVGAALDNGYVPPGVLDGIGAYELNAETVRIFVNHELPAADGYSYDDAGVVLTGARVSYFDIDKTTYSIVDGGLAYSKIYDASGTLVIDNSFLPENKTGFDRFCSGSLFEAGQFEGRGLADRIYFAGEETGGNFSNVAGAMWALDVETGELHAMPAMGRGAWENVAEIDTGTTTHVAFILGDDTSPFNVDADAPSEAAPMYLYVGEKSTDADAGFLERNGLKDGDLYVWVPSDPAKSAPDTYRITDGALGGEWVRIDNTPDLSLASEDGSTGFDEYGYPTQKTLWQRAEAEGAFRFSRPEDVSTSPTDGTKVVFASTGVPTPNFGGIDNAGEVYTMALDFSALLTTGEIGGTLDVLYDGDSDALQTLRSPDNLDWADDGFIYVQEDRAGNNLFGTGAINPEPAGVVRLEPTTGEVVRIAVIDPNAISPQGAVDENLGQGRPLDIGSWESSGILDVSTLFGKDPGTLFLTDVQAHSLDDQNRFGVTGPAGQLVDGNLVEGGQLLFLEAPGVDINVLDPVEPIGGSLPTAGDPADAFRFSNATLAPGPVPPGPGTDVGALVAIGTVAPYGTLVEAVGTWNSVKNAIAAPDAWSPALGRQITVANFVDVRLDLDNAVRANLDLTIVGAKRGEASTASGNDTVEVVFHSNGGAGFTETFVVRSGSGDDVIDGTTVARSTLDNALLADNANPANGALWRAGYDGRLSVLEVEAGAGDDTVTATDVQLVARGGSGADTLTGGIRADRLDGGADADTYSGGGGDDLFILRAGETTGDEITDFAGAGLAGGDTVQLAGFAAGATLVETAPGNYEVRAGATAVGSFAAAAGLVVGQDVLFV